MSMEYTEEVKQRAHDRAEQIRLGVQSTAVLYARALAEEDWRVLGYQDVAAWSEAEFGMDRFSRERRQEIVVMLTQAGWTQRKIAAVVKAGQDTVKRDQQAQGWRNIDGVLMQAGELGSSQELSESAINARQQAARNREETRGEAFREAEAAANVRAAEVVIEDELASLEPTAEVASGDEPELRERLRGLLALATELPAAEVVIEDELAGRRVEQELVQAEIARTWELTTPGAVSLTTEPPAAPERQPAPRHPAEHYVPAALDAMRRGLSQGQFGRDEGLPDNSMTLGKAWGIAGERRRAELQAAADAEAAMEAELQERTRQRHVLAEWADQLDKTVAGYRDAPGVVLDDLIRRLADLRQAL